ncbi:exported protein family 1, putative [Plasmodium sp. gorilla clade G3]|nr:exported protein family 1, putative [Plasmodium sp. gorilla clade G3]
MIIMNQVIFFNFIYTSDMVYEYTGNTKISTFFFFKICFEKNISIEDISHYVGHIMKEVMEGQTNREGDIAELLKDQLDLYLQNEEEWEKLMEKEIMMLLKSSFSNFMLESKAWIYENISNIVFIRKR